MSPLIIPRPLRTLGGHMKWGMRLPHMPHLTRSFAQHTYCRWERPSKSFPRAESCAYLGPGIDHPSDSLRMLTRANSGRDEGRDLGGDNSCRSAVTATAGDAGAERTREKLLSREGRKILLSPRVLHCRYWGGELLTNSVRCLR